MLKWLDKIQAAVFIAFCILFVLQTEKAWSDNEVSYEIADIAVVLSGDAITYTLSGTVPPVYNVTERFTPFRVVVDIAGAFYGKNLAPEKAQLPENSFATLNVLDIKDQPPARMRFEFTLADSHDYAVEKLGNSLVIKLFPAALTKTPAAAAQLPGVRSLNDFKVVSTPHTTTITISSNGPLENYTVDTISSGPNRPPRMFIDIADVAINELVPEKYIGTSVDKIRVSPHGTGARIVFDSATEDLFKYTVAPSADGLHVVIDERPAKTSSTADPTLDQLIGSSEKLLKQAPGKMAAGKSGAKAAALQDDFSFSGYKKQRISVDFYKIDIHNVFRLFRQITDLNIIVDEQVQGVLTLALTDVPWDFALDIILNLMDLKKEERFNTIVIYPAKKEFVWPTRAEDNLEFKADIEVLQQEALVIEKSTSQPKEVMLAKEYMGKAQNLENREEFEEAAQLYTKAFELWPQNARISNRLATLYLVNLGMNAKAVHYAKESLKHDPKNDKAALYAAIASANMQRTSEAKEYFAQSISNSPPMKEALMSFAAFSENNGQNDAALKLLDRYHSAYGETLDTMIAKARILDKTGRSKEATKQYLAILTSGFQLRPDLRQYIEGRLAAKDL
ncbi:secretin and TonB N-terminal domain-containing protein [Desulfocastanea catecholica]